MFHFVSIGIILGLSAGFSPGPLLTLVISETLQHGTRAGIKVACAPVITDLPIILLTLLLLSKLAGFQSLLGIISLAGGLFMLFSAWESLRVKAVQATIQQQQPRSLLKGILANLLNPYPYLFWISVGAPTMTRALSSSPAALSGFIGSFYLMLVGSKILLALAVGRSRTFLSGRIYLYTLRTLGLLLIIFGGILLREGLKLLGIV